MRRRKAEVAGGTCLYPSAATAHLLDVLAVEIVPSTVRGSHVRPHPGGSSAAVSGDRVLKGASTEGQLGNLGLQVEFRHMAG